MSAYTSDFRLAGEFLGYELKGHKIHSINLVNHLGRYRLKLSSEARDDLLRAALKGELQVGDRMEVLGTQKRKGSGEVRLKVSTILQVGKASQTPLADPFSDFAGDSARDSAGNVCSFVSPTDPGPKTQILVCQKSNCCKRGGKGLCKAFERGIEARGLDDRVKVKRTGCLKKCGKGPNIIVGKTRHHHVQVSDVSAILDEHFAAQLAAAQTSEPRTLVTAS